MQQGIRQMAGYGRSSWLLSAVAIGLLLMGVLVYLVGRGGAPVYFLTNTTLSIVNIPASAQIILNSAPSFFHIYAFILLTAIVLNPSRTGLTLITLGWMGIELFFEIGQHPFFAQYLTKWIPAWFADLPFLEVTDTYFMTGTFDPLDVLFLLFGTVAALLTIGKIRRWEVDHV